MTAARRSRLAGLLLLGAAASPGCGRLDATPPLPPSARTGNVRPADLRDEAAALLVLPPDRRVLAAFADLEPILSRGPRTSVEARRLPSGRFALTRGQEALGELPAFASFEEALALLGARASLLLRDHPLSPLPAAPVGGPDPAASLADPLGALAVAEQRLRAETSAASVRDATRAAVALARIVPAEARSSDVIHARALALLAIGTVVAPAESAAERPLLADAMGYPEDAARARTALAAERARHAERLPERVESAGLTPAALAGRLRETGAGGARDAEDEIAVARAALALSVLEAARANGDERAAKARSDVDALAPLTSRAVASVPKLVYGWLGTQPAQAIGRFPFEVAKAYAAEPGPLLDAELHRAAIRGFFFDAVSHLARQGDVPELAAAALPQSRVDARLAALRAATPGVAIALAADEAREVGDVGAIDLFTATAATRGLDDAERAQLPTLLRAVDGRPANRAALAPLVRDALGDDETARRWSAGGRGEPAALLVARVDAASAGLRGPDREGGARALASPAIANGAWSRVVAPRLVGALRGAPDADVDASIVALRGAGLGLAPLRALAVALLRDGRAGPAGRLAMTELRADANGAGGSSDALDQLSMQIVARRAGLLPAAALPPHLRDLAAQIAFDFGEDDLLRVLGPAARPGDVAELRLLLRAAAAVRARDHDRQVALRGELAPPAGRGFYGRLAAFVLDGVDAVGVEAGGVDPAAACEALRFLSLRAETQGGAEEARAWRRAAGLCPAVRLGDR